MRTGKFGITLSDVQLDIEKRSKNLKDRQQRVHQLHEMFAHNEKAYGICEALFKTISDRYENTLELYLRSDATLKSDLRRLSRQYDSLLISFNDYTSHLSSIGKTGHNQQLDVQEIEDFKRDGFAKVDFIQDEIKVWDYKRWALVNLDLIENEIDPSMGSLVKIDAELNDLREKLRKDSVDVMEDAKSLLDKARKLSLSKYDSNPMPVDIFSLKIQELNYGSYLARTRDLRDSADLRLVQSLLKEDVKLLSRVDSVVEIINRRKWDYDIQNYRTFVTNGYGSPDVLKSFIKTTADFAVAEKAMKKARLQSIEIALNWIIDKQDSIPVTADVKSGKYFSFSIMPEKYTYGIILEDTLKSYFYTITPSRRVRIKAVLPLDTIFKKENVPAFKHIGLSPPQSEMHFIIVYSDQKITEKIPSFLYSVGPEGLVWSTFLMLNGIPEEATFNEGSKSLYLKITNETGSKIVLIDKEGKSASEN